MANANKTYKRAIIFLVDGARDDQITHLIMQGKLPNIQKYFLQNGKHKTMLTCFPTTTGPAYLPYLTGCFPGTCNIPGIRWFDKPRYAKKGWGPKSIRSYCGLETNLFDKDMTPGIKTAWDKYLRSFNIIGGITKGINKKNDLTKKERIPYYYYAHLTDRWAFIDNLASQKLTNLIKEKDFDFVFAVFPAVDEYAHRSSPLSERTKKAYAEADAHIGKAIDELVKKDILDDTLLVIVSDHGLTQTTKHFDVGPWLEKEKGIKTLYHTNIFKFNFKATTMVSGNGMCHIYFKMGKKWEGRAHYEELKNHHNIISDLIVRDEVSILACQAQDASIHLVNKIGHGWFKIDQNKIFYSFDNKDPLGIFEKTDEKLTQGFDFDEGLKLSFNSQYPDIFMQMHQLFKSPRTGDIVISATKGSDFREKFEIPLHKASHGAILPEHMKVPLIMNHPIEKDYIRSVDVFPTILKLTGKDIPEGIDGKSLVP